MVCGQSAAKEPDFVEATTDDHTAGVLFLVMSAPGLFRIRALAKQPFECPPCRTSHVPATWSRSWNRGSTEWSRVGSQGLRAELDDRAYDWGLVRLGRVQHSRNTENTTLPKEQRGTTAEAGYRLCRRERTSRRGTEEDARGARRHRKCQRVWTRSSSQPEAFSRRWS